jgi:hypothetical protein
MVKWIVIALLVPAIAHANEIAIDEPVVVKREPPAPPRDRSVGFRFGMMNTQLAEHERTMIVIGAQWNLALVGSLRAVAEYDYLIVMGSEPDPMQHVRGRGHDLRAGGRFALLDGVFKDAALFYIDVEATGGVAYITDNIVGPRLMPNAVVGARLGYEMWMHDPKSQSTMFGGNVLVGAMLTQGDVGFTFQVGMEWGQHTKR